MRDSYGKLIYALMDSQTKEVKEMLGFECVRPIKTVYDWLQSENIVQMLDDPLLHIATEEIFQEVKNSAQIQREVKEKEREVEILSIRYKLAHTGQGMHGMQERTKLVRKMKNNLNRVKKSLACGEGEGEEEEEEEKEKEEEEEGAEETREEEGKGDKGK
ncbi:putative Protein of unknown function (DUF2009) [Monocercomonoides exilis]|uniref:putative Protein of unknown function (DUF2009) n=1 Tax=Monocercomonoides exilis TaxID=2049356 RepID=UPI003559CAE2|nr:putative Protein of unknown function (DUF2009) [Monocercomonoides exilis]|eukprot:MONOS_7719.1-p1 / transcript=MONOS_7719.1 / gene=MONOS_7719 / organism=Monocercomonoides_exilis_PA203 / gene_product=unspecified product / transcript_product=unspecified product / location=Mono_scaffold00271:30573-31529(+) / protein_length=159 / sequence_SO=supercontig / SO=protein_coding / is_pseudo=false